MTGAGEPAETTRILPIGSMMQMQHGDFTTLADNYAKYRPAYAPSVLDAFLALAGGSPHTLTGADVGAGTGIWTRMLAKRGVNMTAIEPNAAMRAEGMKQNGPLQIDWRAGSAEATELPNSDYDLVSMASSFHWPDFDQAVAEFHRILKPGGLFLALWNTRRYESNPLLVRIEEKLRELVPDMRRVSSGRSAFCNGLLDRFAACVHFRDALYLEGRHVEIQTPERYIGLWESVNDVRVQAGEERFKAFLDYIRHQLHDVASIEAEYTTRAWLVRRPL